MWSILIWFDWPQNHAYHTYNRAYRKYNEIQGIIFHKPFLVEEIINGKKLNSLEASSSRWNEMPVYLFVLEPK